MTYQEINHLVIETYKQILFETGKLIEADPDKTTPIMGPESLFDSVDLVNFIVNLEQLLEEDWAISILLADERAMSQTISPFRNIGSICEYIEVLINEV